MNDSGGDSQGDPLDGSFFLFWMIASVLLGVIFVLIPMWNLDHQFDFDFSLRAYTIVFFVGVGFIRFGIYMLHRWGDKFSR